VSIVTHLYLLSHVGSMCVYASECAVTHTYKAMKAFEVFVSLSLALTVCVSLQANITKIYEFVYVQNRRYTCVLILVAEREVSIEK